jgi:hypothetical protein
MIPEDVAGVESYIGKAEQAYGTASESLAKLGKVNEDFLAGKIPDDVAQQLKTRAAEMGAVQGLGSGSMVGRKTLRDFGITSISMMERGMQNQAVLAEQQRGVATGLAGLSEVKERVREFNSSFAQQGQQLLDATRRTN